MLGRWFLNWFSLQQCYERCPCCRRCHEYPPFWCPIDRYALNIGFNLLNKSIFKYFPFPLTVSTVHVVVGTLYCAITYLVGKPGCSSAVNLMAEPRSAVQSLA